MPDRAQTITHEEQTYSPVAVIEEHHRQSIQVWIVVLGLCSLWVMAILAAPIAKHAGSDNLASDLYTVFGYICHQISNRSFHVYGAQFAVCSRCFGVYAGILIGILVYPMWRVVDTVEPLPRFWLFLSLIPISIDWSLTIFGIWENTQFSRLATGLVLGFVCVTYIVPALVEITRNLSYRGSRR
jgi:uncharacterized membrane protein